MKIIPTRHIQYKVISAYAFIAQIISRIIFLKLVEMAISTPITLRKMITSKIFFQIQALE